MKTLFKKLLSSKTQSKHFSETVQRVGKNNAGFSLVELIVVIAIMAILATVAVIGVSVYIPKAQKAADEQLISDVIDALTLQYYQNEGVGGGFVILTREGVVLDASQKADEFGAAAMEAAFGVEWAQQAVLQYEWNSNLSGSSVTTIEANKILETATSLTGIAAAVVGGNTPENATNIIYAITNNNAELRDELKKYESDPNYSTIASNLLVKHLSGEIGDAELTEDGELASELSGPSNITMTYAMLYSMSNSESSYSNAAKEKLKLFDEAMEEIAEKEKENSTETSVMTDLYAALEGVLSDDMVNDNDGNNPVPFGEAYEDYIATNGVSDINGIIDAMGFVNSSAQEYSDTESLSNSNLFSSDALVDKLTDYQNANKYGVVIRIDENGEITVLPEDAGIKG